MMPYPPPFDRLMTRKIEVYDEPAPDYLNEYGFGPEHVPDLIRMVGDPDLYDEDSDHYVATIHARRILGKLKAVEAVGPLLDAMDLFGDLDDFWIEELPVILAEIGPSAIPALTHRLGEKRPGEYTRLACVSGLEEIAKAHPETRETVVAILTDHLARKEDGKLSWTVNASAVSTLTDLEAVEAAPVIEAAFAANLVDQAYCGDWPRIRFELGLGPEPAHHYDRARWSMTGDRLSRRPDPAKLLKKQKAAIKRKKGR